MLLGGLGSLACLAFGVWRWTLAYTNYGPAVVWRWSLPWFSAALGLSPLFLLGLISLWRTRRKRVLVYPSGLVYQRGKRTLNLPWQEIAAVRTEGPWFGLRIFGVGRPLALVLETSTGQRIRLTQEFSDFKSLVAAVKQRVYPRMLKALTQRFNQGEQVPFGPLTLGPEGVSVRGRTIPWAELARAELDGGELTLHPVQGSNHKRVKLSTAQVPNVDLCLQMIQGVKTT